MKNFNLNIDEYSDNELFDLLTLTTDCSIEDIEVSKIKLASQLFENEEQGPEMKQNILLFLDTACERLKNSINTNLDEHGSNMIIKENNENNDNKERKTLKRALNIDSRFRENYFGTSSSNFTFELPTVFKNAVSLNILALTIPLSYYSVSESLGNNSFIIHNSLTGGNNHAWLVKLPDGNYDNSWFTNNVGENLETKLNIAITKAQPGIFVNGLFTPGSGNNTNLSNTEIYFAMDKVNGRSMISSVPNTALATSSEPSLDLYFNVNTFGNKDNLNLQMKLGWLLGFRKEHYTTGSHALIDSSDSNTTLYPTYISEGICMINSPTYGYIAVDDFKTNYVPGIVPTFSSSSLDKNILARLNLSSLRDEVGALKIAKDSLTSAGNYKREYNGTTDINKLKLSLLDEFGREINLNNMDWSILLEITTLI